jgi:hypothetical protein
MFLIALNADSRQRDCQGAEDQENSGGYDQFDQRKTTHLPNDVFSGNG